jgi:AcrR family transcriptional regulator
VTIGSYLASSGARARTRAAILAATASVFATNRSATLSDVANAAGVGRTTVHRYFTDRDRLIYEATTDSIRLMNNAVAEAATEQGSASDAIRRTITALISVGDRILFLYGDPSVLRGVPADQRPNEKVLTDLIERGQAEGTLAAELSTSWILHALYGLLLKGCEDAHAGDLPRHTVAPLIIRTFEHGMFPR